jgi:hypothetical protein
LATKASFSKEVGGINAIISPNILDLDIVTSSEGFELQLGANQFGSGLGGMESNVNICRHVIHP